MATRMTRADPVAPVADDPGDGASSTRQRILDIALDLFTEKGYEKTSLREIAAELGFSKAAVYYHFASKDDILLALHYRFHDLTKEALDRLDGTSVDLRRWLEVLDDFIDKMLANRKLFVMHERNRAAFEQLHQTKEHEQNHGDLEARLRSLLTDSSVSLRDRVRIAASIGAVMGGLLMSGEAFGDVPTETLGGLLRESVRDLLVARPGLSRGGPATGRAPRRSAPRRPA
jgi:AcrR family transcriptional regulator